MTRKLEDKVAVITGGTSGIGLATARLFVEQGAFVFIIGRRQGELDEATASIGRDIVGVRGDVTNLCDLDALYETVKSTKGHIDVVFANAGVGESALLEEMTEAHVDNLLNTNVKGVLFTVQKALPLFSDGGSIIVTGAVTGSKGTPTTGVYSATKAAVRALVRVWTNELKDRGIRSNVVSPGPIETRIQQEKVPADIRARLVATTPMGRLGQPEEVAKAALFLASDDSSFVTGIELFVDGGRGQV
jgi:NAD(P)-dependent dehydrogenase (short-subunit alcohol dehydrogenase family)